MRSSESAERMMAPTAREGPMMARNTYQSSTGGHQRMGTLDMELRDVTGG